MRIELNQEIGCTLTPATNPLIISNNLQVLEKLMMPVFLFIL